MLPADNSQHSKQLKKEKVELSHFTGRLKGLVKVDNADNERERSCWWDTLIGPRLKLAAALFRLCCFIPVVLSAVRNISILTLFFLEEFVPPNARFFYVYIHTQRSEGFAVQ